MTILLLYHVSLIKGQDGIFQCASHFIHEELLAKDVTYSNIESSLENEYVSSLSQHFSRSNLDYITLPIVVHIVHEGGSENISDPQIQDAITNLNDAFRNVGYYNPSTGEDTRISFCLASRSPANLETTGITRSFSPLTNIDYETEDAGLKNLARWNSNQYINVWVVKNICFYGDCRIAGYATSPVTHGFPSDGIVIEAAYFGSSPALTTSFIHEMGHFLGLAHTFQGSCKNDNCLTDGDRVCDTPPDNVTGYFPCNFNYNSCTSDEDDSSPANPFRPISFGGLGDQPDMHQNYMDYGASECFDRFSLGQVERMHFFIENHRKSLLSSFSCYPPCLNPPLAIFNLANDDFLVGEEISLVNNSLNSISNQWLINGAPFSSALDTSVSFGLEGIYEISLVTNNLVPGCSPDTMSFEINVICPTVSSYSYNLSNDSIFLFNSSLNVNSFQWSIEHNGQEIFVSDQSLDTFHFTESGYYHLCLTALGLTCDDFKCEFIRIFTLGSEDCQNGIDDDGDGLIDFFDIECECSPESYQATCPVDCLFTPDSFPKISLKLKWESNLISDFDNYPGNLTCGDIDGDGSVEVISSTLFGMNTGSPPFSSSVGGILILSGSNGQSINSFNFTPNGVAKGVINTGIFKSPSSNSSDIFFLDYNSNKLVRYDRLGLKKWESETINLSYGAVINFADFNADGIAEIYMNSMIFNAETGKILAVGNEGIGGNKIGGTVDINFLAHSIAADLLPSPGLELAAGNTVYVVELNNQSDSIGNHMVPILSSSLKDGLTGLADFDGDQQLDVVLVRSNDWLDGGGVSIWNPRSGFTMSIGPAGKGGGIPAIGDLDADCIPEIVIVFANELIVYNYTGSLTLEVKYKIPTSENFGTNTVALFDFNQDGLLEIVYRDQENLLIINGSTGEIIDSYPILSGTFMEGPIIADIDNNNSAEIIINGSSSSNNESRVYAFESAGHPWSPARSVWNQYGYHVTNVNDDLSIPKEPQNFAKHIPGTSDCSLPTCEAVYNSFMNQATLRTQEGCIQFPAKDLKVENLSYSCSPDSLYLYFSIENTGNDNISTEQVYLTAWSTNPFQTNAEQLFVKTINLTLSVGQIDTLCLSDLLLLGNDSIFIVVNDIGSFPTPYLYPGSTFEECDYQNNIIFTELNLSPLELDLGPDITKCNSEVITLVANNGFESYMWNDGSMEEQFSTSIPGVYFVQTKDKCQRIYSDTIQLFVEESFEINLGPDQTICPLETLEFTLPNTFDWIQWFTTLNIACDTCQTIQVSSDTSYLLIALAGNGDCIVQDSVSIEIVEAVTIESDQFICPNERFEFFGDSLAISGTYSHLTQDCDSLFIINLLVGQVSSTDIYENICEGDSINIGGQWFSNEGSHVIELSDAKGCDSLINLSLSVYPNLEEFLVESICIGDSILFGSAWIYTAGTYTNSLQSVSGCDSIINLELKVESEFIQEDEYNLCEGDSLFLANEWVYASGLYLDTLNQMDCDLILQSTVSFHSNFAVSETLSICGKDSIWLIDTWVHSAGLYDIGLTTVHGCDSTFHFNIENSPVFPVPTTEVDCQLSSVTLNIIGDSTLHVNWDNGDTTLQTTYISSDSARWSIYYDPLCIGVFVLPLPEVPNLLLIPVIPDTTIPSGTQIGIDLGLDSNEWIINWESESDLNCDTCASVVIYSEDNTVVSLHLTHLESGCTYDETFQIYVLTDKEFYLPTVFSPNGDGINDIWTIGLSEANIEFHSVEIFDRWGNQVANWKKTNLIQWDGLFKGNPLQSGVYVIVTKYTISGNTTALRRGTITLIR